MLNRRIFLASSLALAALPARVLAQDSGRYVGELLLKPLSDGRLMQLQNSFGYVDPAGARWPVPAQAVVDGASIPRVLWPVVGGPWEGSYRQASVVHDWYCAVRTRPWKHTHKMFYDAMRTSGVPPMRAKIMFLAVFYAGPSWDDLTLQTSRILSDNGTRRLDPPGMQPASHGFASTEEANAAEQALLAEFDDLSKQVIRADLPVDAIEHLVNENGRAEDVAAMLP